MNERRTHWLRTSKACRYPRRIVCLDSEARQGKVSLGERHTFRLAFASFDELDRTTLAPVRSEELASLDVHELWTWIDSLTRTKERTCLFAHNLGYDLRLTRALVELPALGWELRQFSLDSYRCWARWRRGERTLLMVDTMSFVGRALGGLASELGHRPRRLPQPGAPDSAWLARCRTDTLALRELVLRLLPWLEAERAGDFRMTGPAQGQALFRHRFLDGTRLLVHEDAEALSAERTSAWTGRCEVWRHGAVEGPLVEWDYSLAYARLAREAQLPVRLRGQIDHPTIARVDALSGRMAVLVEAVVDCDEPVLPAEHEHRILWPVGRFEGVWWDRELELAREHGAQVTPRRAWLYQRAPLLRAWAEWLIERLEGPEPEACPVARAVLKGWSRSLIGRFGLRYPRWEETGETEAAELLYLPYVEAERAETGVYLRLGRQLLKQAGVSEAPDSAPAVMAYVMALARVRLWRASQLAGAANVAYLDTDSLLVSAAGDEALRGHSGDPALEGLRPKASYRRAVLHAPRQIELDRELRAAGVPKNARRRSRRVYEADVWEGLAESLLRRREGEVLVYRRRLQLRGEDHRRRHLAGGATAPIVLG